MGMWKWICDRWPKGRFSFPSLLPVPRRRPDDQALLERLDEAERQVAILEDKLAEAQKKIDKGRKRYVEMESELANVQKELEAQRNEVRVGKIVGLQYASLKIDMDRAMEREIAAQAQIGALESELRAVQKVFEKQSRNIRLFRSAFFFHMDELKKRLDQFEEEWNVGAKQEAERKDCHQRVDHDHGGADQRGSGGDRDRGAEVGGGQSGGGSATA